MSLRVGLTGGIGSGKTQISNRLGELGVEIIDTDKIAREIVVPALPTLNRIVDHFGTDALTNTKHLDRAWLRKHVFDHPNARVELDRITHPVIAKLTAQRLSMSQGAYCVAVIPLLIEASFKRLLDHVVVVTAPIEKRITWIMNRNQLSRSEVLKIIDSQVSDDERVAQANATVQNNGSLEALLLATDKLHLDLHNLATKKSNTK